MRASAAIDAVTAPAIAWSAQATVGDIAVAGPHLTGRLAQGLLDCQLTAAGKFRNGAARWWCAPHQCYWGVKADLARGDGTCRCAALPLQLALAPLTIALDDRAGAPAGRLGFSLAAHGAIAVDDAGKRRHAPALALLTGSLAIFAQRAITQVNLTPPALAAMAQADGCVDCARCGFPHLDLGDFAARPHRRHTCGHCGNDTTHSGSAIVSNPLFALARALPWLHFDAAPAPQPQPQPQP